MTSVSNLEGLECAGEAPALDFPLLDPPREDMRFCPKCLTVTRFVARAELANGLLGRCTRCNDERVVEYTHTVIA